MVVGAPSLEDAARRGSSAVLNVAFAEFNCIQKFPPAIHEEFNHEDNHFGNVCGWPVS